MLYQSTGTFGASTLRMTDSGIKARSCPPLNTSAETADSTPISPPASTPQTRLFAQFRTANAAITPRTRAQAGLCLRCYVSYPILKACQKIAGLFSGSNAFTYQDLLPFVLNDDGKTLVILDPDDKTQLILDHGSNPQPTAFKLFTVEVLRTYQFNGSGNLSLDNWVYLQTKQHPELKSFLSEFGFQALSDWALLNRARPQQLARLSDRDRHLVEVFHAVYRRDRIQQPRRSHKCPDPNSAQLSEMQLQLQERQVFYPSAPALLNALKQVATQLRHYDLWQSRESLEVHDPETGAATLRPDLPAVSAPESDLEQQEWLAFLHQQLQVTLVTAIDQAIQAHLTKLTQSKKYAPYAPKFLAGLQQYYRQGLSLKELAPQLGMTSSDQARRVLNPGELLSQVRAQTVQQMLEQLLAKAQAQGLATMPPAPEYLKTLAEQIEAFVDAEIFQAAVTELKAGKNRAMTSPYAEHLTLYFAQCA
jgi:hypothetical protein